MYAEINIEQMGLMADLRDDSTYEGDVNTRLSSPEKKNPVTVRRSKMLALKVAATMGISFTV